jgi:hypothetical protein
LRSAPARCKIADFSGSGLAESFRETCVSLGSRPKTQPSKERLAFFSGWLDEEEQVLFLSTSGLLRCADPRAWMSRLFIQLRTLPRFRIFRAAFYCSPGDSKIIVAQAFTKFLSPFLSTSYQQ